MSIVDPRESILSRLETVLAGVEGVTKFQRNDLNVPEGSLGDDEAVVILLDGDEDDDGTSSNRGRPARGPLLIHMMPEMYVVTVDKPALVGPALNTMRRRIKAAILNDTQLLSLVKDGDIRYEGCQTALALGRSMLGEMGLNFTFVYVTNNEVQDEGTP